MTYNDMNQLIRDPTTLYSLCALAPHVDKLSKKEYRQELQRIKHAHIKNCEERWEQRKLEVIHARDNDSNINGMCHNINSIKDCGG